ncbi:MAG: phytoene desaturase family protein [Nannocystaceae bacterium]
MNTTRETAATSDPDVIVIGAGPNGLVAATYLANAGLRVLVLEANERRWGGALGSEASTRPGFVHDVGAAFFPFAKSSPAFRGLDLARAGLAFANAEIESAHPALDGSCAGLARDLDRIPQLLAHDADAERLGQLLRWHRKIEPRLFEAMLRPLPNLPNVAKLGLVNLLKMGALFTASGARLSRRLFRGADARRIIPALALHTDVGPEDRLGAGIGYMLAVTASTGGFSVPIGGAQAFADAIVHRLEAAGGSVRLGAPVTKILTEDGRAFGVRTRCDGVETDVRARVAVVANTSVPSLFCDLIDAHVIPGRVQRFSSRFPSGWGTFKVDWALRAPVPWSHATARLAAVVHTGDSIEDLARFTSEVRAGQIPSNPYLVIGQQSLVDPSRAPEGAHTLWAYSRVPPTVEGGWALHAEQFADRIDARIEGLAPGFSDTIIERRVTSPRDLQDMNANLIGGDLGGGSNAWHRQLFFRPLFPYFRYRTPLRNLYLSSSYAHPGAGVHGMCGMNAAHAVLDDLGATRRLPPSPSSSGDEMAPPATG